MVPTSMPPAVTGRHAAPSARSRSSATSRLASASTLAAAADGPAGEQIGRGRRGQGGKRRGAAGARLVVDQHVRHPLQLRHPPGLGDREPAGHAGDDRVHAVADATEVGRWRPGALGARAAPGPVQVGDGRCMALAEPSLQSACRPRWVASRACFSSIFSPGAPWGSGPGNQAYPQLPTRDITSLSCAPVRRGGHLDLGRVRTPWTCGCGR